MSNQSNWATAAAALGACLGLSGLALAQPTPGTSPAQGASDASMQEAPVTDDVLRTAFATTPGGLMLSQLERRALASSATVQVRQAELEAAQDRVEQTTVAFFPRLSLKATYTRLSKVENTFGSGALVGAQNPGLLGVGPCPGGAGQCVLDAAGSPVGAQALELPSLLNNYAFTATLLVPLSDYALRLPDAAASAADTKRAAATGIDAEKLKVVSDARLLYFNWLRSVGQTAVAKKSLERSEARRKDAEAAFTVGTISKADLMRLETLVANTELIVKEAENYRLLAERQLAIVMGEKESKSFTVGEDIFGAVPATSAPLDALIDEALRRRLELKVLDDRARALRSAAGAVRGGMYPRLDAIGEVTYANPNQRYFPATDAWNATWFAGLSATWTINDTFANRASGGELEATARQLEAQRRALADGIRLEVSAAYLELDKARLSIEINARAIEAAEEAYRVAADLYRVGRATTTELIEAEGDLLSARLREVNARVDVRSAHEKLIHATGKDVRGAAR